MAESFGVAARGKFYEQTGASGRLLKTVRTLDPSDAVRALPKCWFGSSDRHDPCWTNSTRL